MTDDHTQTSVTDSTPVHLSSPIPIKASKLSLISLILSVIIPPVGLIIALVVMKLGRKITIITKRRLRVATVIGAILIIPFIFLAWQLIVFLDGVGTWDSNTAQKSVKPLLTKVEQLGGTRIYEVNATDRAFYSTQYVIYDTPGLTDTIRSSAAGLGYNMVNNTVNLNVNYLKKQSDYLVGSNTKTRLVLSIERDNTGGGRCLGHGQPGSCDLISVTSTGF